MVSRIMYSADTSSVSLRSLYVKSWLVLTLFIARGGTCVLTIDMTISNHISVHSLVFDLRELKVWIWKWILRDNDRYDVGADLSPSAEPSPSLEAEEVCLDNNRISSGSTSSLRWTVKDVLPRRPNPNLRLRPKPFAYTYLYHFIFTTHHYLVYLCSSQNQTKSQILQHVSLHLHTM